MDLRYSRELALQRLEKFCRAGFVSVTDFRLSPLKIFAAHEVAALVDPSMATKMTVQFNLFGEWRRCTQERGIQHCWLWGRSGPHPQRRQQPGAGAVLAVAAISICSSSGGSHGQRQCWRLAFEPCARIQQHSCLRSTRRQAAPAARHAAVLRWHVYLQGLFVFAAAASAACWLAFEIYDVF
jgi:hypothetical protein